MLNSALDGRFQGIDVGDLLEILQHLETLRSQEGDWYVQIDPREDALHLHRATELISERHTLWDKVFRREPTGTWIFRESTTVEQRLHQLRETSTSVARSVPTAGGFRETEMAWMQEHLDELRRFKGEWIVLDGENLISHNSDYVSAIEQAKSKGVEIPFVVFVPAEDKAFVGL